MEDIEVYFVSIAALAGIVTTVAQALKNIFKLKDLVFFYIFTKPVTVMFTITVVLTIGATYLGAANEWGVFKETNMQENIFTGISVLLTAFGAHAWFIKKAKVKA